MAIFNGWIGEIIKTPTKVLLPGYFENKEPVIKLTGYNDNFNCFEMAK